MRTSSRMYWRRAVGAMLGALLAMPAQRLPAAAARPEIFVKHGEDGRLVYGADAVGNRVVDFSHAGYGGGGEAIPFVPVKVVVPSDGKRDRERIQAALDLVAALPIGADGFRGAVLLAPGKYSIDTCLRLAASGVVLRGSGEGENGTLLAAVGESRRTLIEVGGRGGRTAVAGSRKTITDAVVPVGASKVTVDDAAGFPVGSRVMVQRPSTAEWIGRLGMDAFPGWRSETRLQWRPGSRDLLWDRVVTAVNGNALTLDAPLTTAIEQTYGGGTVARYEFAGRIEHVGVENLSCVSECRPGGADEEHAWCCIALDKVENAWVRQVTARQFVSYVIEVQADAKSVTIEDCTAGQPVSEIASFRRRVFSIGGQRVLVQRCRSEHGLRDFTTGFGAAGPNVFLRCAATGALDYSGPVESWASGLLYDNVQIRGNALRLLNRGVEEQGSGWAAANSLLWNCEATDIQVQSPPGAPNQAYGCKGDVTDDSNTYDPAAMPYRDFDKGMPGTPASLYEQQLIERIGAEALARLSRQVISIEAAGAPALADRAVDALVQRETARKNSRGVHPLKVEQAQFTIDGRPAWTTALNFSFFQGQMPPALARSYGPAITRFAPGETGLGLTDDLEEVVAAMEPGAVFYQHYGLWYDRRRVNHNYYGAPEHKDGTVWGPFMEQPWARSGEGKDWDGLSKYDLTRFNPWYFARVKEFADIAATRGVVLYYNVYFQHPLQETRAHYTDFPWRPVNCLQETGLPDENPAASTFYDLSSPIRRTLHELYIRHCLDVLGESTNVVFGIDREYSGPLSFVQFWLDTIAAWEKEHHRKVFICLEVPKAEMDAILADPVRGPMITAIDYHFWFYRPDGSLFTIEGGLNKAPREQQVNVVSEAALAELRTRVTNSTYAGGNIVNAPEFQRLTQTIRNGSAAMRYRALREYRDAYPELVVVRKTDEFPKLTGAIEQKVPASARARMRPANRVRDHADTSWCMAAPGQGYLVYSMGGDAVTLDLGGDSGTYAVDWIDSASGELSAAATPITAGQLAVLTPPETGTKRPWVAWLVRRQG